MTRGRQLATFAVAVAVTIAIAIAGGVASADAASTLPRAATLDDVRASVAAVSTDTRSGTGWVVARDRIITNAHVVTGSPRATVRFEGMTPRECRVARRDPLVDLVALVCDRVDRPALPLGTGPVQGEQVMAVGYALGGPLRATHGTITDAEPTMGGLITTDAALASGNSGGPILNADGEVVAVAVAIDADDRARNFGISASAVRAFIAELPSGPISRGGVVRTDPSRPQRSTDERGAASTPDAARPATGGHLPGWAWFGTGTVVGALAVGAGELLLRRRARSKSTERQPDEGGSWRDLRIALRDPPDLQVTVQPPRSANPVGGGDDNPTRDRSPDPNHEEGISTWPVSTSP